ncbi:MAG: response regulator transcription factor [Thermodesulfobacteriota bacterium]|jgi:DNA-binding NarL/FixJ family response regulator|nr:response regulator transcription factor [Thermodesulfobacteriota bacterium]
MATDNKAGVIKILLVEDHPVFRLGLRELIEQEPDLLVCGEAKNVGEGWEQVSREQPDLVIVDISLDGRNGLELVKQLKKQIPQLPALVLSMYEESLYAERALQAGARGYIMKHETADLIIDVIRKVCAGEVYLSAKMTSEILAKMAGGTHSQSPHQCLTSRELEVFEMIGHGLTTKEISTKLCLSTKTIGTYRERIKEKLNLRNTSALSHRAVQWVEQQEHRE